MSARFADTEEAIQRIERTVTRIIEQAPSQQPFVRSEVHPIWHPWMTRLAVPALMLAALAMGVLIGTSRGHTADAAAPLTTGDPVSTPAQPATKGERGAASTTEVLPDTPPTSRERRVSVSQRAADRTPAPTTSPSSRFVGTLSISSVPSGASVSINGKPAGRTPLRLPRQRAGSLAVQVAHDGFERWSAAVLVPADQLTHVTARLRASAP